MWPERTQLLKKMFHRRIGINSAVTDGLIVALLLLGEDILLSIQGFVLNFVRELIPNILNIVGAVPRCPILPSEHISHLQLQR